MRSKKKIGILTYWETKDNYGQLLQHWALQQYLRNQGCNPYLVRYMRSAQKVPNCSWKKRIKNGIKKTILYALYFLGLLNNDKIRKRVGNICVLDGVRRRFNMFRHRHMTLSNKIYHSYEQLKSNPPKADVYMTGSDQVWNYQYLSNDDLEAYLLHFGLPDTKRMSFAASVGTDIMPSEIKTFFKLRLKDFNAISVRETTALSLCEEMGYSAQLVLDPTMLLKADDYKKLISNIHYKNHVFIYSLNYSSCDNLPYDEIVAYAKSLHSSIVVTPGSGYMPAKELFENVKYIYSTPGEWISTIANAKLTITASFHGIVFCILFHCPFVYTPLKGEYAKGNVRILGLLKILGLEDRIWDPNVSKCTALYDEIDWDAVDEKVNYYRNISQEYLLNNLSL